MAMEGPSPSQLTTRKLSVPMFWHLVITAYHNYMQDHEDTLTSGILAFCSHVHQSPSPPMTLSRHLPKLYLLRVGVQVTPQAKLQYCRCPQRDIPAHPPPYPKSM